jgi:four helix bundle protein
MSDQTFFNELKKKMDQYVRLAYKISKELPKDELYGVVSQLRRAALSVILNYIEGYARKKTAVKQNFWEISYGSLKESKYLIYFTFTENLFQNKGLYGQALRLSDEIGAMLWTCMESLGN